MNMTTIKSSQANQTSATPHMKHIFKSIDKTITKIYLTQQFVKCNNSIPFTKRDCYKTNEKCRIVATINPISHSHPVYHGTFFNVLIDKF